MKEKMMKDGMRVQVSVGVGPGKVSQIHITGGDGLWVHVLAHVYPVHPVPGGRAYVMLLAVYPSLLFFKL